MKLLVTASINGQINKLNDLLKEHQEVDAAICLGDMCLLSKSSPIEFFLRSKFRHQAQEPIELNDKGFAFAKPVYFVYGALDDPFIPANEFKILNLFPMWQGVVNFAAYSPDKTKVKSVSLGFLSGYYNLRKFKKRNTRRLKMSRERQSIALCLDDFNKFKRSKIDFLFSYESPEGHPITGSQELKFGSPHILDLINKSGAKINFYGHHRTQCVEHPDKEKSFIGVGELSLGYYILDLYSNLVSTKTL